MTDGVGLFDLPEDARVIPPEPEVLTRGQRRARLVASRIAAGRHPLGYVGLHPDAARDRHGVGLRCGGCRFREVLPHYNGKRYPKCTHGDGARISGCESSDIRRWWPACTDYRPIEEHQTSCLS